MHKQIQDVICECCGRSIQDDEEHNAYHNVSPHPTDTGSGLCAECVDYTNHIVFDQQVEIVAEGLNEVNKAKFMALPFGKQCWIIIKLHEKGTLTWNIG